MEPKKSKTLRNIIIAAAFIAAGVSTWKILPALTAPDFCFNFVRNMQFGDREVKNPVNVGFISPGGLVIYPETKYLHAALIEEGFYIDPYEATGGQVYAGAFFGPSTRTAISEFQKKHSIESNNGINDATLDKLGALYSCPR